MKKKTIAIVLTVALVVVAAFGATYAYFTANQTADNIFTVGSVEISLTNATWDSTKAQNVYPGKTIDTAPTVNNTGKNDAYVRVIATIDKGTAFKTALTRHSITDLTTIFSGFDSTKWTVGSFVTNSDGSISCTFTYKDKLTAGTGSTGALFTAVTIPGAFDNTDFASIAGFKLTYVAQAVQADGFTNAANAFSSVTF